MNTDQGQSTKDFSLPSLTFSKRRTVRTCTIDRRKHPSHRHSSPSPHKLIPVSVGNPEAYTKIKYLVPPYMSAKTWAVFNPTNSTVLFSQGGESKREIASLTKIMTCYLSILLSRQFSIDIDKTVVVSSRAAKILGTSANLNAGDCLTIFELLHGLMLPSGNDAAYALAEFFGSLFSKDKPVRHFVEQMNKKADEFGLKDTKFRNPHGMSNRPNFSTAKDVCILASHALKDKLFSEIVNKKEFSCELKNNDHKKITWKSTNKLLGKGVDGVKTGQTPKAGNCLCARFIHSKFPLIITVLACKSKNARWVEVPRLADWVYSKS